MGISGFGSSLRASLNCLEPLLFGNWNFLKLRLPFLTQLVDIPLVMIKLTKFMLILFLRLGPYHQGGKEGEAWKRSAPKRTTGKTREKLRCLDDKNSVSRKFEVGWQCADS